MTLAANLFSYVVQRDTVLPQNRGGAGFLFVQQSEEQVLRSDVIIDHGEFFTHPDG